MLFCFLINVFFFSVTNILPASAETIGSLCIFAIGCCRFKYILYYLLRYFVSLYCIFLWFEKVPILDRNLIQSLDFTAFDYFSHGTKNHSSKLYIGYFFTLTNLLHGKYMSLTRFIIIILIWYNKTWMAGPYLGGGYSRLKNDK